MRVCVGGTFNVLHAGHAALLARAFELAGPRGEVFIGLTSDRMARSGRGRRARPYRLRRASLARHARRYGARHRILRIGDEFGAAADGDYDAIVVSDETLATARALNKERRRRGLKPLEIANIGRILADDGLPINSTRVLDGDVDRRGRILGQLLVAVGSANPVKVRAAERVFRRRFKGAVAKGVVTEPGVPAQPRGAQTSRGALERARQAIARVPGAHFGVGVEAGLSKGGKGRALVVEECAIVDRGGRVTSGHGPGFALPRRLVELLDGGMTLNDAMEKAYGVRDAGRRGGAVGHLSKGLLDRQRLTEQAVLAALVPRVRGELYG